MKKIKFALKPIASLLLLVVVFVACEDDFSSLDSDIINNNNASHFNSESETFPVISYNKSLDPVQTNNLPANLFGVYDDPTYGRTTASFVTQLRPSTLNPDFGDNVELDSVVITIPYYSKAVGLGDENQTLYELDSVFGSGFFKLKIYESNYYLRSFDPNSDFDTPERYYSNGTSSNLEPIPTNLLEDDLIYEMPDLYQPDNSQIVLKEENEEGELEVSNRLAPALRIAFSEDDDLEFWQQKIIDMEGEPELSNQNNFSNYFRGMYFKAEAQGSNSVMALLNLSSTASNVTLYYTKDPFTEGGDRVQTTYTLNFGPNRVNFYNNAYNINLQDGDETNGDSELYLKGGEGSMAVIDLFDGEDLDDNPGDNVFEEFKRNFAELDDDGNFKKSKRLINEANLVFYVNQDFVNGQEPERVYLYDLNNNIPLVDYYFDATSNDPLYSRSNHLGRLERDENDNGVRYKMKITEHIKRLVQNDSTNVKLGLVVADNVNIEGDLSQYNLQTEDEEFNKIPRSSIISPKGTVLHGNASPDEEKRVFLQIYYTEPDNQ